MRDRVEVTHAALPPLQDLPAQVWVVRPQHALTGKVLQVFGKLNRKGRNRKGQLLLVLTLPDGTRSYFPAAWTDLKPPAPPPRDRDVKFVASLAGLLCLRQRVEALRRRLAASPGRHNTLNPCRHDAVAFGRRPVMLRPDGDFHPAM